MSENKVSRRIFIMGSAAAAMAGCASPSLKRAGYQSPNEKINIGAIGAGGKGGSDIQSCKQENVIALCDADWRQAARTFDSFPDAKQYFDFRDMLDKETSLDAVTVSTPDHFHAVASMAAMKRGLHVYCQKPMTHTIYEARAMTEAAKKYKVATQMGNQGHSGEGVRKLCEMIWNGDIGDVREVHAWTNRPVWPQGISEPLESEAVPEGINWDLWLGPAPWRPFNSKYAPFNWRGWWDFGCGALGDMACHILDPINWALKLGYPVSVECIDQEGNNEQTFPNKTHIKFEFPRRKGMPPVDIHWYDGRWFPPRPEGVDPKEILGDTARNPESRAKYNYYSDSGSYFVGDKGVITTGTYGGGSRVVSTNMKNDYKKPEKSIPRIEGRGGDDERHKLDWIRAIKNGGQAGSNFGYAGPFTEWIVMGNLCLRFSGKLKWDGKNMRFTNRPEANQFVHKEYRKRWEL